MAKLTDIIIRNLKPGDTRQMIADDHARGLYLRVYPGGAKAFVMRSAKGIKTLGRWPDEVSLADARRIAHGDRKMKSFMYNKQTVGHLAKEFYDKQIEGRYRRPEQTWAYLERDLTSIESKRVVDVTLGDLATLIGDKVKDGPVAANRLLAIVKKMFRFAVKTGVIQADPAALLDRSVAGGREVARERVLNDDEIRKFWAATAPGQGTPWGPKHGHGPLLRFLLLTGQRLKET
ncbi:MAG TPA: integrase family protein, partial [Casimicrobiaceae bacterium]